jgi:hypothetical protein
MCYFIPTYYDIRGLHHYIEILWSRYSTFLDSCWERSVIELGAGEALASAMCTLRGVARDMAVRFCAREVMMMTSTSSDFRSDSERKSVSEGERCLGDGVTSAGSELSGAKGGGEGRLSDCLEERTERTDPSNQSFTGWVQKSCVTLDFTLWPVINFIYSSEMPFPL